MNRPPTHPDQLSELRRSLVVSGTLMVMLVTVGTAGYIGIEGWSFQDSLWMVVITLTTIGYSEAHPLSDLGRDFTMALIVGGVSVGTYAMSQLTAAVLDGRLAVVLRERRTRRRMKNLSGHYIVVGFGRLGAAVAHELRASGAAVCVIERSAERAAQIAEQFDAVLAGDAGDDAVLQQAGLERAKGLAVTVPSPAEALYITLAVRQMNPTVAIHTRVETAADAEKARKAGATAVLSPHTSGGWRMAHALLRPHTTSFLDLAALAAHPHIHLDEIIVPESSPFVGKTLADLRIGHDRHALVIAIRTRDGEVVGAPSADNPLHAGDVLIVIGRREHVEALAVLVTSVAPSQSR